MDPQPVLEHPLSDSSLEKETVAGQLVRVYADYFDESIKSDIELKELQLDGDTGLFGVTYYTAMTAMRLIRGASLGYGSKAPTNTSPPASSPNLSSSPALSSSPMPIPLIPHTPPSHSPVASTPPATPSFIPAPVPAAATPVVPPPAIDIGRGRAPDTPLSDQKCALEESGRMRDRALELSIEISASLNEAQMQYIRDTCFGVSRDYLKPLLRHVFVDQRLSATLSTSLSIILIQWVPIWIISDTNISDLKLRIIDVLIGTFAEFLEDYQRVRKSKDGTIIDEAAIVKGFAALFAGRKQRFLFSDASLTANDAKDRIVDYLFEIAAPIIDSVSAKTSELKRDYASEYRELILGPLGIVEEAISSLLSPAMLYELVQFIIGKLEETAKAEKERAKAKAKPAAKPKLAPCNIDFRVNVTRLKDVLAVIADAPTLLRGVVDFLCTFFVMDAVQQQIQESLGTLTTPKAKFDILRTFRNIMWDYNPKTSTWTPIVNPALPVPSERERQSKEKLMKRMVDALLAVISANNPIGFGTGLLESTIKNLVQCLLSIAQQPRVVQILLYQYLAPRVLSYLK